MARLYFIPVVTVAESNYRCPAYLPHRFNPALVGLEDVAWAWELAFLEDIGLVAAEVTVAQHALLNAQPGVVAVPANLDGVITAGQATAIRTRLEGSRTPAEWCQTGLTYREVLRGVLGVWQVHNRLVAVLQRRLWSAGLSPDSLVSDLPSDARQALRERLEDMGLDTSGVQESDTLRAVLRALSLQTSVRIPAFYLLDRTI